LYFNGETNGVNYKKGGICVFDENLGVGAYFKTKTAVGVI